MPLKSTCSRFELQIISQIAKRAAEYLKSEGREGEYPHVKMMMDLEFAHTNCPMHLDRLLNASPQDFNHDVFGIRRHMNRTTGHLVGGFHPRHAINR